MLIVEMSDKEGMDIDEVLHLQVGAQLNSTTALAPITRFTAQLHGPIAGPDSQHGETLVIRLLYYSRTVMTIYNIMHWSAVEKMLNSSGVTTFSITDLVSSWSAHGQNMVASCSQKKS